jgi:magnesium chelatase subunit D
VDGLRADIVIARAAAAHAAWRGAAAVSREDIRAAARLALPHRRRRNPFDAPGLDEKQLDEALGDDPEDEPEPPDDGRPQPDDGPPPEGSPQPEGGPEPDRGPGPDGGPAPDRGPETGAPEAELPAGSDDGPAAADETPADEVPAGKTAAGSPGRETVATAGDAFRARRLEVPGKGQGAAGRRSRALTDAGRSTGSRAPQPGPLDLHLTATLTASAPYQRARGRTGPGLLLEGSDLRAHQREGRESNLVLFAVDASGSMAARRRMEAVKGAVLSLLLDAYQRRDKVGLICFRGAGAELLLPPTSSVDAAARRLASMPAGGRTPLAAGLAEAQAVLRRERLRDPLRRPLLVVVTDGRVTAGGDPGPAAAALRRDGIAAVVVDCESGPVRLGLAAVLAQQLGAEYLDLARLSAGPQAARGANPGGLSAEYLADSVRQRSATQRRVA